MESKICWAELLSNHLRICVFNFPFWSKAVLWSPEEQMRDGKKGLVLSPNVALKDPALPSAKARSNIEGPQFPFPFSWCSFKRLVRKQTSLCYHSFGLCTQTSCMHTDNFQPFLHLIENTWQKRTQWCFLWIECVLPKPIFWSPSY